MIHYRLCRIPGHMAACASRTTLIPGLFFLSDGIFQNDYYCKIMGSTFILVTSCRKSISVPCHHHQRPTRLSKAIIDGLNTAKPRGLDWSFGMFLVGLWALDGDSKIHSSLAHQCAPILVHYEAVNDLFFSLSSVILSRHWKLPLCK